MVNISSSSVHETPVLVPPEPRDNRLEIRKALDLLASGAYQVPNFQRDFVWNAELIRELVWSLFHQYYVGSLLLWDAVDLNRQGDEHHHFESLHCTPLFGTAQSGGANPKFIVLDGQQRLTALHYAFFAPSVAVTCSDGSEAVLEYYTSLDLVDPRTGRMNSRDAIGFRTLAQNSPIDSAKIDEYDNEGDWQEHIENRRFPLRLLSSSTQERSRFLYHFESHWQKEMAQAIADIDKLEAEGDKESSAHDTAWARLEECDSIRAVVEVFSEHIEKGLLSHGFQVLELPAGSDAESVRDMFMQVNRHGRQLTGFDLYNAELSINGDSPKNLLSGIDSKLRAVGISLEPELIQSHILELILLRTERDEVPIDVNRLDWDPHLVPQEEDNRLQRSEPSLIASFADLRQRIERAGAELLAGLQSLRAQNGYATDATYAQFVSCDELVPLYSALLSDSKAISSPEGSAVARVRMIEWYWASALAGYQFGKDRSARHRDYENARERLTKSRQLPVAVSRFRKNFRSGELRDAVRAEQPGSVIGDIAKVGPQDPPLFRASLSYLYSLGPLDPLTGLALGPAEDHTAIPRPIIPEGWCEKNDIVDRDFRSVFNWWLVSPEMADFTGDQPPWEWMRRLDGGKRRGGNWSKWTYDQKRHFWQSHCIPCDPTKEDKPVFLLKPSFQHGDFRRFLEGREQTMLLRLGKLFSVDFRVPWEMRKLADSARRVEGELKRLIVSAYESTEGRSKFSSVLRDINNWPNSEEANERKEALFDLTALPGNISKRFGKLLDDCTFSELATLAQSAYPDLRLQRRTADRELLGNYGTSHKGEVALRSDLYTLRVVRGPYFHQSMSQQPQEIDIQRASGAASALLGWLGIE